MVTHPFLTTNLRKWCYWLLLSVTIVLQPLCNTVYAQRTASVDTAAHLLRVGAEILLDTHSHFIQSKTGKILSLSEFQSHNLALVGNQTSLVGSTHLVDTLLASGYHLTKIFCPEHGFRGTAEAGAKVDNSIDVTTGLPIISLYGKNKKPSRQQLADIDLILFDLQDVGCRFYTYISTLHYVMEACAEQGIPLIVLDRPNPNGYYVDGPILDTAHYRSFVGMHPVPVVYGMTIGEYAQMINGEHWLSDKKRCDLYIVPLQGYNHSETLCRSIVLPVAPSPNLRTQHAIALYPSLCYFEGTNCGVGRGTDYPFEWITYRNDTLDLRQYNTSGSIDLMPLIEMYHRVPKGELFLNNNFFEKLAGTDQLRKQLENGLSAAQIRATWQSNLNTFRRIRQRYLLYP